MWPAAFVGIVLRPSVPFPRFGAGMKLLILGFVSQERIKALTIYCTFPGEGPQWGDLQLRLLQQHFGKK